MRRSQRREGAKEEHLKDHTAIPSQFTTVIRREDDLYVAVCPELDVASQGTSIAEATTNLKTAVRLFLETASEQEVKKRLQGA